MKQTVGILTALTAVLLLATSFIVAANIDLSRRTEEQKQKIALMSQQIEKTEAQLKRSAEEEEASAEMLRKTMEERDSLSQQLNDAIFSAQEANEAVEQQMLRSEKQLHEMESLAAEYEDLSQACDALEMRILTLSEEAAKAAMSREAQSMADASRIAELEAALEQALAVQASPVPTRSPEIEPVNLVVPTPGFMPLVTVTSIP